MITCCKACTSRYRACHDTCNTYLTEKEQADTERTEIQNQHLKEVGYIAYVVSRKEAARRRH